MREQSPYEAHLQLPALAVGYSAQPEVFERLKEAAAIVNHMERRQLFVIEEVDESVATFPVIEGHVPMRITGEWTQDLSPDASKLWAVKLGIDAYLAQDS